MIRIDFYCLIAFYLSIFIIFFFLFELGRKIPRRDLNINPHFIWYCSVCTYTYIDTRSDFYSICPRCGFITQKIIKSD
ncbi:MAG: hypothetical protein NC826_00480 [Candidatus Omnitrophica bacterium]|nr:hypothetical protein [Candidatus Omnitrophota bacterium]